MSHRRSTAAIGLYALRVCARACHNFQAQAGLALPRDSTAANATRSITAAGAGATAAHPLESQAPRPPCPR
jgi:hypothetical protein